MLIYQILDSNSKSNKVEMSEKYRLIKMIFEILDYNSKVLVRRNK